MTFGPKIKKIRNSIKKRNEKKRGRTTGRIRQRERGRQFRG